MSRDLHADFQNFKRIKTILSLIIFDEPKQSGNNEGDDNEEESVIGGGLVVNRSVEANRPFTYQAFRIGISDFRPNNRPKLPDVMPRFCSYR
jgi:hypothetical protein